MPLGKFDDLPNWRDIAIHRIQAFEHDQLRPIATGFDQQFFQVTYVVVTPDFFSQPERRTPSMIEL